MRWLRNTLIILSVTCGMFFLLEGCARVAIWRSNQQEVPQLGFGYSRTGLGDLIPNLNSIETIYPLRPYRLVSNSVGLRNTEEVNPDPNVLRVMTIGDSFTFGFYVHNEEAYPSRLEELLEQNYPQRFQVLNAAMPGYTLADELAYLQDKGLQLEPDMIVLGFYTNDIFDYMPELRQYFQREAMMQNTPPILAEDTSLAGWLTNNSALYNGLLSIRGQLRDANISNQVNRLTPTIPGLEQRYHSITFLEPDTPDNQVFWQAYEADFRALVALLNERNISLVLVAFPDLNQYSIEGGMPNRPQEFLANLTTELNVPFVDMLPIFREQGTIQNLYLMYYDRDKAINTEAPDAAVQMFYGDGHLSMYGHWVTAQALAPIVANILSGQ
jgi:hypothetical protein